MRLLILMVGRVLAPAVFVYNGSPIGAQRRQQAAALRGACFFKDGECRGEQKDRGTGPCPTVARDYEGGRSLRHGPVPCLMTEQRDGVQFYVSLENVVCP